MSEEASPPPFGERDVPSLLARAASAMQSEMRVRLGRHRVPVNDFRVLANLAGGRTERVGRLAELCALQQPTMTKLLDRMETAGLLDRRPGRVGLDRRVVNAVLTEEGEALAKRLLPIAAALEAEAMRHAPAFGIPAVQTALLALTRPEAV